MQKRLFLSALFLIANLSAAVAGLTVDMYVYCDGSGGPSAPSYFAFPFIGTNDTGGGGAPITYHQIYSPSTNIQGGLGPGGMTSGGGHPSLDALLNEMVSTNWTLIMNVGDPAEKTYKFAVSSTLTTNDLPQVGITSPTNGATGVATNPLYQWRGPAGWTTLFVNVHVPDDSFSYSDGPPPSATNWTGFPTLPNGTNIFSVIYRESGDPFFTISVPVDETLQSPTGWVTSAKLESFAKSTFEAGIPVPADTNGTPHILIAHYPFDDSGDLGLDISGNDNHINSGSSWGTPSHDYSADAVAGAGAVQFYGVSSLTAVPPSQTFSNWFATVSGSFTFSAWVKTTVSQGDDSDNAFFGATVFWAYNDAGNTNDLIPFSITGSKAAFTTRGEDSGLSDTLHSTATVNDDVYHHIVVTRDQSTGEKKIYVDGVFEDSELGTTNILNGNDYYLSFGGTTYSSYTGLLDDVQIYYNVLSSNEIAALYNNPGSTAPDTYNALAGAVDAPELTWTTGGDSNWFRQTSTTYDGQDAAESGSIFDDQISYLETTVAGPGAVTFWWKVSSEQDDDYLEFNIDGTNETYISGEVDWQQESINVGNGPRTLRWQFVKGGSGAAGDDRGWLDQVVFTPASLGPISVDLTLYIYRSRDASSGDRFLAFPGINSISPSPITLHRVESPNGLFTFEVTTNAGGAGATSFLTLDAVIDECTNGVWKIFINKDDPAERLNTFTVSISGLDTNLLTAVTIHSPSNGSVNVATNPAFTWSGPTNFFSLFATASGVGSVGGDNSTNLSSVETNWPSPPVLNYGSNRFYVSYFSNNIPHVSFTTPTNSAGEPISGWTAIANLRSDMETLFVVGAPAPLPADLLGPQQVAGSFRFSFQTQAGRPHTIEALTNLPSYAWTEITNFVGDGTLRQLIIPATNPPVRFFRVRTE